MLLESARSQLLIVDMQERLLPAMHEPEAVEACCSRLIRAARRLDLPVLFSQQYPRGLGATVPALRDLAQDGETLDKVEFSCAANGEIMARIAAAERPQVVIAGIEAHVCVLQTAVSLHERGFVPVVVLDAVASRKPESVAAASARMCVQGIEMVTSEMAIFEWLQRAGTPEFKELSALIR